MKEIPRYSQHGGIALDLAKAHLSRQLQGIFTAHHQDHRLPWERPCFPLPKDLFRSSEIDSSDELMSP